MFTLKRKNLKRKGCPKGSHYRNKYKKQFMLCGVVLLQIWILSTSAFASIADQIVPKPQIVKEKEFEINLDNSWVIVSDTSQQKYNFSAQWLKQKIEDSQSVNFAIVNFSNASTNKRIILGNPKQHDYLNSLLTEKNIGLPPVLGNEGYVLNIFNSPSQEIIIAANAPNGVFYGVQTFLQLIEENNAIKGVSIIDFPDHKMRGIHTSYLSFFGNNYPPKFSQATKDKIDRLAGLKINVLCITDEFSGKFFQSSPEYVKCFKKVAEYCRDCFIEFIPNIGSLRDIRGVPFELFEGWWIKDEKFKFEAENIAVAEKPMANLLYNGGFEIDSNGDNKPDGWTITGTASIDTSTQNEGSNSLKIESGSALINIPVDPDKHYYFTVYAKGSSPAIDIIDLDFLYNHQIDRYNGNAADWHKLGAIIKTSSAISQIRIKIKSDNDGTILVDKAKLYRIDGGLKNVIRGNNTDIEITNLSKTSTYQENVDYEITDGTTNKLFDETLNSFDIKRIVTGSIASEQQVLVSYDTVLYSLRSKYYNQPSCVSNKQLYTDYFYPAIDNVITYLSPKIINFESDEIRGFNRDSRNIKRGLTNAQLFAEWINKINSYVKQKDPNCRVMIWDDMVSPYHNGGIKDYQVRFGGSTGRIADAVEQDMIDTDVIMSVWWYGDSWLTAMASATDFFEAKGFDYFGSPWHDPENIQSWSELLVNKPGALGGLDTNWGGRPSTVPYPIPGQQFSYFADQFWNTRSQVIYFNSFEKDVDNNGIPDGWHLLNSSLPPENVINNPSFEQDLAQWKIDFGKPDIDNIIYHDGNKSVHFNSNTNNNKGVSIKTELIPIESDTDYELTIWGKGNNIIQGSRKYHKLFLAGRFYDANKKRVGFCDLAFDQGSYDWKLFRKVFHVPGNAAFYQINRLGLLGTATGEAWIDNISLYKYEPSAFFTDGKEIQGRRYANFPNCAVSVKGESEIFYSDFIQIKPNLKYVLSAHIKRYKINGKETPCFKIIWHNSDQQYLSETTKVVKNVNAEYKCFEMGTVSPQNAFYAKIYLQGQEGGDEYFWFDTVYLKVSKELKEVYDEHKTMMPPMRLRTK